MYEWTIKLHLWSNNTIVSQVYKLLCLTPNPLTFISTFVELGVYRVKVELTSLKILFLKIFFFYGFRVD